MPFIEKQDKTKLEPLTLKIRPEVIQELELYARFLEGSEPSWVVQEALRKVFAQDKDFQKWKTDQPAEKSERDLDQIRKPAPSKEQKVGAA